MAIVKYFPTSSEPQLLEAAKKNGNDYLSAKVIQEHSDGSYDLVVSVPDQVNRFLKGVPSDRVELIVAVVKIVAAVVKKIVRNVRARKATKAKSKGKK